MVGANRHMFYLFTRQRDDSCCIVDSIGPIVVPSLRLRPSQREQTTRQESLRNQQNLFSPSPPYPISHALLPPPKKCNLRAQNASNHKKIAESRTTLDIYAYICIR